MKSSKLILLLFTAATVKAHAYIKEFVVDGKEYPAFDPFEVPKPGIINQPWDTKLNNFHNTDAFMSARGGPDLVCKTSAKGVSKVAPARAGSRVKFRWSRWQFNHVGPIISYLADCGGSCANAVGSQMKWFKIDEAGKRGNEWATEILRKQGFEWTIMLPKNIKDGQYLLRHENIALRMAGIPYPQIYPTCLNIQITGGTAPQTPPPAVSIQQSYTLANPGLSVGAQAVGGGAYHFPGPPLAQNLGNTPSTELNPGVNRNPKYSASQQSLTEPTDENGSPVNAHLGYRAKVGLSAVGSVANTGAKGGSGTNKGHDHSSHSGSNGAKGQGQVSQASRNRGKDSQYQKTQFTKGQNTNNQGANSYQIAQKQGQQRANNQIQNLQVGKQPNLSNGRLGQRPGGQVNNQGLPRKQLQNSRPHTGYAQGRPAQRVQQRPAQRVPQRQNIAMNQRKPMQRQRLKF